MTAKEAKANQDRIAKNFNLGWWYGVNCEKCCGVYPKLMVSGNCNEFCYFQCEVCGKRTKKEVMPWVAEEAWNRHEWIEEVRQLSLF